MIEDLEKLVDNLRNTITKIFHDEGKVDYKSLLYEYDRGVRTIIKKYKNIRKNKNRDIEELRAIAVTMNKPLEKLLYEMLCEVINND